MTSSSHPIDTDLGAWIARAILLCAGLLAGCGSGLKPCTDCAPIQGSYALTFDDNNVTGNCQGVGTTTEATLAISRSGAQLTATSPGWTDLAGTLYEDNEFSLNGAAGTGTDTLSLQGTYIPAIGTGGTARLDGTWLETHPGSTSSGGACTISRSFTGTRQ